MDAKVEHEKGVLKKVIDFSITLYIGGRKLRPPFERYNSFVVNKLINGNRKTRYHSKNNILFHVALSIFISNYHIMKTLLMLSTICVPGIIFSQAAKQHDSVIVGITMGYNYANWEKIPAGVKTQFNNSTGNYADIGGERHFFRNHPDWAFTCGLMESDNIIVNNARLSTDANGKNILTVIPNSNYRQNDINIFAWGIHLGIQYDIPTSKKGNSKFFIGTGYAVQFISVSTDYITKGDTDIYYSNYNNIATFQQKIIGKIGFAFRFKSPVWYFLSFDGFYGLNSLFTNGNGPYLSPYYIGGSFGFGWGSRKK